MNLARLLVDSAVRHPQAPAVALGERVIATYSGQADRVSRLAGSLKQELQLEAGDVIALAMKNHPTYSEILFAAWHAGCVVLPMNSRLHPREFSWILANAGARVCVTDGELAPVISDVATEVSSIQDVILAGSSRYEGLCDADPVTMAKVAEDDLAWLFYTSGTTGRPKGAMLSHGNLRAMNAAYFANVDDIGQGDCIIHAAPMSHGSGLYLLPHVERGTCQVIPDSGGFNVPELRQLLRLWKQSTLFLAPTMLMRLMNDPDLASDEIRGIKTIVYGGGPMYLEDLLKVRDRLDQRLVQIYGQGEAPMTITALSRKIHGETSHPRSRQRLSSVGRAQKGVEVRVVGEDGHDVGVDETGEILVRGPVVMQGYFGDPDATAETLRKGWLHTGDMGSLDTDGFLTLKDRSKDLIITGGTNVYPREVEEVLLRHDAVQECAVVGQPHSEWGEQIVAFIVAREDVSESELDKLCLDNIARFKRPRAYRFIESLPKNNYGKVLKSDLRKLLFSA